MNRLQPGPHAWDGPDPNTQLYSSKQYGQTDDKHTQKNPEMNTISLTEHESNTSQFQQYLQKILEFWHRCLNHNISIFHSSKVLR